MRYALTYTQGGFENTNTLIIEASKLFGRSDNDLIDTLVKGSGWLNDAEATRIVKDHTYYLTYVDDVDYKVEEA